MDVPQLFQDSTRRITQARPTLPLLQQLPKNVSQEADEDVRLDSIFSVVPDGSNLELRLVGAKRVLHLGELDVRLPDLLLRPIADVRAQRVPAVALLFERPLRHVAASFNAHTRR